MLLLKYTDVPGLIYVLSSAHDFSNLLRLPLQESQKIYRLHHYTRQFPHDFWRAVVVVYLKHHDVSIDLRTQCQPTRTAHWIGSRTTTEQSLLVSLGLCVHSLTSVCFTSTVIITTLYTDFVRNTTFFEFSIMDSIFYIDFMSLCVPFAYKQYSVLLPLVIITI